MPPLATARTAPKKSVPAAKPKAGSGYLVKKGSIFLGGKKVGFIDAKGHFHVVDAKGKTHTGHVPTLLRNDIRLKLMSGGRAGATGRLRLGQQTFEVRGGQVFFEKRAVGTVSASGEYALEVYGRASAGHVNRTPGAVWLNRPPVKGPSTRIELAGKAFVAVEGVIFEAGEEIGWVTEEGRFRGVTLDGDHFEGSLTAMKQAVYLKYVPE